METKDLLKNLEIQSLNGKDKDKFNSFTFVNLPNELAITLGNYLRRILLSYIGGVAISALKISNGKETIKSEFVPLEGLVETPPYFILNLKNLVIKKKGDKLDPNQLFKLFIDIDNNTDSDYLVTGNDVKSSDGLVEVLNPELYLATVSPNSSLKVELLCNYSWGFKKQNDQKIIGDRNDLIIIDSNYNPIKNVSFKVNLVVIDLDKQTEQLTLEIRTNGSISPREALMEAMNFSLESNKILIGKLES